MEDKEIIQLYFTRNECALEETSKKYGSILTHISENILKDVHEAGECLNDTLLSTWNQIPPTKPDNLLAYLAKSIRYISLGRLDYHNAKKRRAEIIELSEELENSGVVTDNGISQIEEQELSELVSDFLRQNTYEQRVVFLRGYWYGDSISQISELMGISEGKVKTILFRMRKRLKQYLEKEGVIL